jgi:hypothetical protein
MRLTADSTLSMQEARRLEVLQRRQQRELEQMINYEKKRQVGAL